MVPCTAHVRRPNRPYGHAGNFELQCRVGDHVRAGMRALYSVLPSKQPYKVHTSNVKRTYYIQAEPATWDYAPGGYAQCSNTDPEDASVVFLNRSASTIGSVYRKAVYRWGGRGEWIDCRAEVDTARGSGVVHRRLLHERTARHCLTCCCSEAGAERRAWRNRLVMQRLRQGCKRLAQGAW